MEEKDNETPGESLSEINKFVVKHPLCTSSPEEGLLPRIADFINRNRIPASSPNLKNDREDDVRHILTLLRDLKEPTSLALTLECTKILLRKELNRKRFSREGVSSIAAVLRNPLSDKVAEEAAKVVLNMCYEDENVTLLLEENGIEALVALLRSRIAAVQEHAAGALQSVCFQARGRVNAREKGALKVLIPLLSHKEIKIVARCVGALHNITSDPLAVQQMKSLGGTPRIIELLSCPYPGVASSAAGTLQNLGRDEDLRQMIRKTEAVPALTKVLFGSEPTGQVCAAGALLNLLGSEVENDSIGRVGFKKLLSDCIALGAAAQCVAEE